MAMPTDPCILIEPGETCYLRDDITRGLRAALIAVLGTALAGNGADLDFLRGALALARSQAALYGIPWREVIEDLYSTSKLGCLIQELQDGVHST